MTLKDEITQIISEMTDVEEAADKIISVVQRDVGQMNQDMIKGLEGVKDGGGRLCVGSWDKKLGWRNGVEHCIHTLRFNLLGEK